jgi:hypothetical protein
MCVQLFRDFNEFMSREKALHRHKPPQFFETHFQGFQSEVNFIQMARPADVAHKIDFFRHQHIQSPSDLSEAPAHIFDSTGRHEKQ